MKNNFALALLLLSTFVVFGFLNCKQASAIEIEEARESLEKIQTIGNENDASPLKSGFSAFWFGLQEKSKGMGDTKLQSLNNYLEKQAESEKEVNLEELNIESFLERIKTQIQLFRR